MLSGHTLVIYPLSWIHEPRNCGSAECQDSGSATKISAPIKPHLAISISTINHENTGEPRRSRYRSILTVTIPVVNQPATASFHAASLVLNLAQAKT